MAKQNYTVLLADLEESRDIPDRRRARQQISAALRDTREWFIRKTGNDPFTAAPAFTRGMDELSAVLRLPAHTFEICRYINWGVNPLKFRFALVRGTIDIGRTTGDAAKMDGPAFHEAAEGIETLRAAGETYFFRFHRGDGLDEWMNRIANLAQAIMNKWSERQVEAVRLVHEMGMQKIVAKHLGISSQAVSDRLRSADWNQVRNAFQLIDKHLAELR